MAILLNLNIFRVRVSLKIAGSCEHISTSRTFIRLNTCVNTFMNLKISILCEHLSTSRTFKRHNTGLCEYVHAFLDFHYV